jgi:hypothetical protein
MAKATAKNVKLSLNQREKLIFLLPSITSSSLTNKKVKFFLQLVKWVLEVLKEHSIRSPNGSRRL